MIHENSKRYRVSPPAIECSVGKIWKTHMDALKVHFQRFFRDQMEFISSHWHRFRHFCKFMWSIFAKATQSLDFIKPNLIRKLAHKVKYINQINGVLIMFFQKFENKIHVLFKCHRFTDNSIDFYLFILSWFLSFYLAVNHESRPFKSNPARLWWN